MILEKTLFLAADTARSQAYAQAMASAGFELGAALVVDTGTARARWGKSDRPYSGPGAERFPDIFVPDLSEPLEESCGRLSEHVEKLSSGTLNAPEVKSYIDQQQPRLIVFSGFGGEIVGRELLDQPAPLLHMHAGWLPDYRGSTTIYYSLLKEGSCGVSAILLRREIDAGPIIGRKRYPAPPKGIDIDYLYDGMIRADLLVTVLRQYAEMGSLPPEVKNDRGSSTMYYIIHPVLKHLAILGLSENRDDEG